MSSVALMFSGGTDSTAAALRLTERFDRVHLVTCRHSGLFHIENSAVNADKLAERFGRERFSHVILDVDDLFRTVARADYLKSIARHGFLMLGNCGLCKLAMHLRTLAYCIENGIAHAADGANRHMDVFPFQMDAVLGELRALYARFDIEYFNPVFDMDYPDDTSWAHKLGITTLGVKAADGEQGDTAGRLLYEAGLLPEANVKGSETDRRMQARCFQLFLFNVAVQWYYLPSYGKEKYRQMTLSFYRERMALFAEWLAEYRESGSNSRLAGVI